MFAVLFLSGLLEAGVGRLEVPVAGDAFKEKESNREAVLLAQRALLPLQVPDESPVGTHIHREDHFINGGAGRLFQSGPVFFVGVELGDDLVLQDFGEWRQRSSVARS